MPVDVQPRGRPPNRGRRRAALAAATDHVLAHGLAGSSLRLLADALGTSHRMLLYDFDTKEALLASVLAEARRRLAEDWRGQVTVEQLSAADALRAAWAWMTDPDRDPYMRLFFEIQVDALRRPEAYVDGGAGMTSDWLGPLGAILSEERQETPSDLVAASAVVAALRGLVIDRLTTGDVERTDRAAEMVIRALTGS